ncbi:MAG: sugar phosphate isomerase/epimerase family protein [Candidatus Latescibacterota bacterium]|nr:sugar phosphate isomerase/epimerase family protein [Candidatus Latescibacterota bacterium]
MKLGASTLLFKERPLGRDLLADIAAAGVDSAELTDYHPGFSYEDPASFRSLGATLRDLGLDFNSLHAHLESFDRECDLAGLEPERQRLTQKAYRRAVDAVEQLGGGILLTHDIRIPEPPVDAAAAEGGHKQKRDAFLSNLGTLADYAADRGVRLALENTGRGYTREPERLVALMRDLDRVNVGVCIDTGHRNLAGDPVEALRVIGDHLITLHIHDNHGEKDEHLLPGMGEISWPGITGALRDIGYGGVFLYELARPEFLPPLRTNFEELWR